MNKTITFQLSEMEQEAVQHFIRHRERKLKAANHQLTDDVTKEILDREAEKLRLMSDEEKLSLFMKEQLNSYFFEQIECNEPYLLLGSEMELSMATTNKASGEKETMLYTEERRLVEKLLELNKNEQLDIDNSDKTSKVIFQELMQIDKYDTDKYARGTYVLAEFETDAAYYEIRLVK